MDLKLIEKHIKKQLSQNPIILKSDLNNKIIEFSEKFQSENKQLDYDNDALNNVVRYIVVNLLVKSYSLDCKKKINYNQLIDQMNSDEYTYPHSKYKKDKYKISAKRIEHLKEKPQHEQGSPKWHEQRKTCLTATNIAAVLFEDKNKTPWKIFLEKCGIESPFVDNIFVHHGKKYEPIANLIYSFRKNVKVYEYGLLIHDDIKFIGASPDGICEKDTLNQNGLSKIVGRMLEIKCPYSRVINHEGQVDGEICPHYYWVQVQIQQEVCDLDECDFLQCKIVEYKSFDEYLEDTCEEMPYLSDSTRLEKGAVIQLLPKNPKPFKTIYELIYQAKYIYPPSPKMTVKETKKWISETLLNLRSVTKDMKNVGDNYYFDRVIYWKLCDLNCTLIKRDKEWFQEKKPLMEQFWNYVLFYRKNPEKLKQLMEYLEEFDINTDKDMASIFDKIHQQYVEKNNKAVKLDPLYRTNQMKTLYPLKKKLKISDNKFYENPTEQMEQMDLTDPVDKTAVNEDCLL